MPGLLLPTDRTVAVHDGFIIGAGAGCDLRLVDPLAAPRHLILQQGGADSWQAATLSLSAPTELNGVALPGLVQLKDGDVLKVGGTELRWLAAMPAAAAVAPLPRPTSPWLDVLLAVLVVAVLIFAVWQQSRWRGWTTPTTTATIPAPTVAPTAGATCRPPLYRLIVPGPATDTPKPSSTPTLPLTPTPTSTPRSIPSPAPTATASPGLTPSPTASPASLGVRVCPVPDGWVKKVVRQGETLTELAQRFGVRAARLRRANCLPDSQIRWGQILYVPKR